MIKTYPWQCMECKTCIVCGQPHHEEEMMFCDVCDRGYHTFCVGLSALPSGKLRRGGPPLRGGKGAPLVCSLEAAQTPQAYAGPVLWPLASRPPAFFACVPNYRTEAVPGTQSEFGSRAQ